MSSNQQKVLEALHEQPATFLITIGDVMHQAAGLTLEILATDFDKLDKTPLSLLSAYLEQFIRSCTYAIEKDEFGEAAHAYYWRGMARLKLDDKEGKEDLTIAQEIYNHWEAEKKAWDDDDRPQIRKLHKAFEERKAEWKQNSEAFTDPLWSLESVKDSSESKDEAMLAQ